MKKATLRMTLIFFILSLGLVLSSMSRAGVANTVHNLSSTFPGGSDPRTIEADTEDKICIFCHTPHNASPAEPLWNHEMTAASYTMYDSEYLQRVDGGYDVPTELGFFPDAGYRSRICLSCHDGTVAIGSVYNIGGSSATISMAIPGGGDKMPATSAGFIDTYLKDDHPVAIKYDESAFIQFTYGPEQRPIELKSGLSKPPVQGVDGTHYEVRLYNYSGDSYVECTSCHDPHTTNEKFLVLNSGSLAQSINDICDRCHLKTNWIGSIHQTDTTAIDNPDGETQLIPGSTVAEAGCAACHKTHGGGGVPYLLRKFEEETCFNRLGTDASTSCHGQTGSPTKSLNIYGVFQKLRGHPAISTSNKHTGLDVLEAGNDLRWDMGAGNQHAECVDCHNPHQALSGTHVAALNQWYPQLPDASTNNVSNVLRGVTGVDHPGDDPLWSDIALSSYMTMNSAVKEYQICFKCHSSYAIRNLGSPVTSYTSVSGAVITDQAWEFSRGNKSAHPVRVTLNDMLTGIQGTSFPGSYDPKALTDAQMSAPWKNEGNQTMYCSDCHGAESEDTTDPRGPHGSNSKYMLKGSNQHWPLRNDAQLWKLSDKDSFTSYGGLFCKNCHPLYPGGSETGWYNNVHEVSSGGTGNAGHQNQTCVTCHVAVPHGAKRSRLIGYGTNAANPDPDPYNYGGNSLKITEFKKAATPSGYVKSGGGNNNCSTQGVSGCHGGSVTDPDP